MIFQLYRNLIDSFIAFSVGLLLSDFFDRRYPKEYKEFMNQVSNSLVNISYNTIYYYGKCQIFFNKTKYFMNKVIESNPTLLKIKEKLDSLSKPVQLFTTIFVKNGKVYDAFDSANGCADFAITSWLSSDGKCVNKRITYKVNVSNINQKLILQGSSDVKFLMVEFKIGDMEAVKINLKTDEFNYYMNGNAFTKDFFIFYLNYHEKSNIEIKETDKCSLKIIDNDVNTINLDFTDKNEGILLGRDMYSLFSDDT